MFLVDWRQREHNSPPAVVCNLVLAGKSDLEEMDEEALLEAVYEGKCLQIHCDGGFQDGHGAAAFCSACRRT